HSPTHDLSRRSAFRNSTKIPSRSSWDRSLYVLSPKPINHKRLPVQPNLENVVARVRDGHFAFPPVNDSEVEAARNRSVPEALLDFYRLCDGALIGDGDDIGDPNGRRYRLMIPRLADLNTTQSYGYIFDDSPLYEASAKWWQIVDYGDSNWLAFDASSNSGSAIIDVFHETVGEPGSHDIVANSMADLLERLLRRDGVYWFDDNFQALGTI
ncbi:MAG: SMI1/KNR4 family protein, partial [Pirellula sp.]